jgi:hypothetical protein
MNGKRCVSVSQTGGAAILFKMKNWDPGVLKEEDISIEGTSSIWALLWDSKETSANYREKVCWIR